MAGASGMRSPLSCVHQNKKKDLPGQVLGRRASWAVGTACAKTLRPRWTLSWTGLCLWASVWVGKERYLGSESLASEVVLGNAVLDCQDKTESKGPPASGPTPSPSLPGADAPGQGHQSGAVVCRGSEG